MADVVQSKPPAVEIRFVGSAVEGYEIQLVNNEGLEDEVLAGLLQDVLDNLDADGNTPQSRARGMW